MNEHSKPLACNSPLIIRDADGRYYRQHLGFYKFGWVVGPTTWPLFVGTELRKKYEENERSMRDEYIGQR